MEVYDEKRIGCRRELLKFVGGLLIEEGPLETCQSAWNGVMEEDKYGSQKFQESINWKLDKGNRILF